MVSPPGYASSTPVKPYGTTGAIIAFTRSAMARAIATGAMISVPLAVAPCASIVPNGRSTVWILSGTHSRNSIQLIRSISRVVGTGSGIEQFYRTQRPQRNTKVSKRKTVQAASARPLRLDQKQAGRDELVPPGRAFVICDL